FSGHAVHARVLTAAVRVDRPAERHLRRLGHPVHDRPGLNLVERHAAEPGRIERPGDRAALDQRRPVLDRHVVKPEIVPPHGSNSKTKAEPKQAAAPHNDTDGLKPRKRTQWPVTSTVKKTTQVQSQNNWIKVVC